MIACNYSLGNTGVGCTPLLAVAKKVIVVPIYDSTQARNRITLATTLNQAFFDALVNQSDATKRWYPLPFIKNAESDRGDNIVEAFNDGSSIFIQQGTKAFSAVIVEKDAPARLLKFLNTFRNIDFGIYIVDKENNLVGMKNAAGYLDPIRVDAASWGPKFVDPKDQNCQKIMLNFNWHVNELDENLDVLAASELVAGTDVASLEGLVDVYGTVSLITTTSFRIELYTLYGTQKNPVRDTGRLVADFISTVGAATSKIRDTTDNADITISSVTETATPGIYDVVITPAQTTGNVLVPFLTFKGRDYQNVKNLTTITIP